MSETKEQNDKTVAGERPKKTLALKRTEAAGQVRQSFSHGRTRQVVVEKTTKRTFVKPGSEPPPVPPPPAPAPASKPVQGAALPAVPPAAESTPVAAPPSVEQAAVVAAPTPAPIPAAAGQQANTAEARVAQAGVVEAKADAEAKTDVAKTDVAKTEAVAKADVAKSEPAAPVAKAVPRVPEWAKPVAPRPAPVAVKPSTSTSAAAPAATAPTVPSTSAASAVAPDAAAKLPEFMPAMPAVIAPPAASPPAPAAASSVSAAPPPATPPKPTTPTVTAAAKVSGPAASPTTTSNARVAMAPPPSGRPGAAPAGRPGARPSGPAAGRGAPAGRPSASSSPSRSGGKILQTLSQSEQLARLRALDAAKIRDAEDAKRAEAEAIIRAEQEIVRKKQEEEDARKRAIEEIERERARDIETKRAAAEGRAVVPPKPVETKKPDAARPGAPKAEIIPIRRGLKGQQEEEDDRPRSKAAPGNRGGAAVKRPVPERTPVKREEARVRGRLTITNAFDEAQRERSLASWKRQMERQKAKASGPAVREKIQREVMLPPAITIQDLANRMAERGVDIIKFLMKSGEMHKITDVIDADTAELIVAEFGHTVRRVSEADVEEGFIAAKDADETRIARAPVVTIMGHVDHGKTSLLDAIRKTNVVSGEAGGITQHIGAYQVEINGRKITFIDTPGHEAFTAMRARGAKVTDIVVLVVAADDGVMPQTIEAINHAKAAKVPLIVAINKIDKPNVDPTRVRTDLLSHEIVVESMSGETLEVEVSALKGTNLDKLLEAINLQAELLDLKANPNRSAEGVVIEAKLESGRGPVGTVLIQRGTLHVGDIIVAGTAWGRVRALMSDRGDHIPEAGPSIPVEVLGFSSAPEAGDQLAVVESESRAREIVDYRVRQRRNRLSPGMTTSGGPTSLEQMMTKLKEQGKKEFPLVVKGDVQGSVEAINAALNKLGNEEVAARIIHWGVGGITESDVSLAATSGAVLCAFNVRANVQARALAERNGVEIRQYSIIYDLVDDIKLAMSGLLAPTIREIFLGNAKILKIFDISKVGKVAGCQVTEGKVERGAKVRLIRDNVVIHEGKLQTLKRIKDEVREVMAGQECGMAFEGYKDMREGDVIECFNVETVQRSL